MSQTYYTILTKLGAELLANATALGIPLKLTKMAVGDGNGSIPNPVATQTTLINEVRRAAINSLSIDKNNPNQIIAEQVIPETEGGWFIHEVGLYDDKANLIAVGNCPPTYKPKLAEGSGRTQVIRMIIIVDNVDSVSLKVDPSVVLATREYVDNSLSTKLKEHEESTRHPDATTESKGVVQLGSSIDSQDETKAATLLAVKKINDEVNKRIPETRKLNNKQLNTDIVLNADDVNALPAIKKTDGIQSIYEIDKHISIKDRVGEHWLSAFRINELPFGCYFRNGDNFLLDSPQGQVLNSFSNNYKLDHGITVKIINGKQYINVPTAFAPDGRGYFERAVNGISRQVGSVEGDAIRNIYGEVLFHGHTAQGSYPAYTAGVFSGINQMNAFRFGELSHGQTSFGGFAFNAENFVPTGPENTVINTGRTPIIYLGV